MLNDELVTDETLGHLSSPQEELQVVVEKSTNQGLPDTPEIHAAERSNTTEYPRKTILQKLKLFDAKKRSLNHFPLMIVRPLKLLSFPVVVYCGFSYGASLIWYSILNATASVVLSSEPYSFSP